MIIAVSSNRHPGLSQLFSNTAAFRRTSLLLCTFLLVRCRGDPFAFGVGRPIRSTLLNAAALGGAPAFGRRSHGLPPLAFVERDLWAVRLASAGLAYVGLVAYADRPRGRLALEDPSRSIQVRESLVPGAGLGLFAASTLRRGTVLGGYPGVVIPLTQNLGKLRDHPACEGYIWRFSDNQFVIDPTDRQGEIRDVCLGGNPSIPLSVAIFATLFRFMSVPTTLCRINEPPKGRDVNVITEEDLNARTVTFVLERDVYEGEELYIDYGLSYDRSMYGGGGSRGASEGASQDYRP